MPVTYRTLEKSRAVIIKQPFTYNETDKNGKVRQKRQVQYVEHLDSIFVDEQIKLEQKPIPTPIRIDKGVRTVPDENPQLIKTLDLCPDNEANGGNLFRKIDIAQDELYEIQKYEALDLANRYIMESEENTLRAAAVFFLGQQYLSKTSSTIKVDLRRKVKELSENSKTPPLFVTNLNSFFGEKNHDEKLMTTLAMSEGLIKIVGGKKIAWADSGETIYIAGQAADAIKDFSVWLKNDEEGRQTLGVIADKMKLIKK